jgi:Fe-S-cluster-containing hydrogenase component 2
MEPACVTACPTHALTFVEEGEAVKAKRRRVAEQMVAAKDARNE